MNDIKTPIELLEASQEVGIESLIEKDVVEESDSTEIKRPFDPDEIKIQTRPYTLDLLINRLKHHEFDLQPEFQRKQIWTLTRMSRLIESILLKIPLPMFYFAESSDNPDHLLVVDGMQRLTTLDQYINEQSFVLTNLEYLKALEGKKWVDLQRPLQRRLQETQITAHVIGAGTSKIVTQSIFHRINTGGVPLSEQEIRHALFAGPITNLLKVISESDAFRLILGKLFVNDRMWDREVILRTISFIYRGVESYSRKNMNEFLTDTMEDINSNQSFDYAEWQSKIERCSLAVHRIFGPYAGRKYFGEKQKYPLNKALLEAQLVQANFLSNDEIDNLANNQGIVLKRLAFAMGTGGLVSFTLANTITSNTSSPFEVATRHAIVNNIFAASLEEINNA